MKKELKFKKGLSIVLMEIAESASEYHVEKTNFKVMLYFKSKNAVNLAAKIIGWRFNTERALERMNGGRVGFEIELDSSTCWKLRHEFNCPMHVLMSGLKYRYVNTYEDFRFEVKLNPPKFDLTKEQQDYRTGSTANGESLQAYANHLKKSIQEGSYILVA